MVANKRRDRRVRFCSSGRRRAGRADESRSPRSLLPLSEGSGEGGRSSAACEARLRMLRGLAGRVRGADRGCDGRSRVRSVGTVAVAASGPRSLGVVTGVGKVHGCSGGLTDLRVGIVPLRARWDPAAQRVESGAAHPAARPQLRQTTRRT